MASFNIHLSVGQRYIQKNKVENVEAFLRGCIAPDLAEDDEKSHYTGFRNKKDIFQYLANKVNLYAYLCEHTINDEFSKGEFLHLVTDYLFYNDFFDREYLSSITYEQFCKDLYFSYDMVNEYLKEKYSLDTSLYEKEIEKDIQRTITEKKLDNVLRTNILPVNKLDNFIEKVSSIDLEEYSKKVLTYKKNILLDYE